MQIPLGNYASDTTAEANLANLKATQASMGSVLKSVCAVYSVPYYIAFAFTCLETRGQQTRSADGLSYGCFQTNAGVLDWILRRVIPNDISLRQLYPLYTECKELFTVINKRLPSEADFWKAEYQEIRNAEAKYYLQYNALSAVPNNSASSPSNVWNKKMLSSLSFACKVGVLTLREIMNDCVEEKNGKKYLRMDWVIKGYNGGYYGLLNQILNNSSVRQLDSASLIQKPAIINQTYTKPYIQRLCGTNGYFDLIKQKKFTP